MVPENESQLLQARKDLGKYLRDVWNDLAFAMEVEMAVSPENYDVQMQAGAMAEIAKAMERARKE